MGSSNCPGRVKVEVGLVSGGKRPLIDCFCSFNPTVFLARKVLIIELMQDVGFAPIGLLCTHHPPLAFLGPHCVRCKLETRPGPSSLDASDVSKMTRLSPSMATLIR